MCPGPQPGHTLTSGSGPADRRPACRPTAAALQHGAGLPDPALGCCRYGERATLLLGSQSGSADSVSSRQIAVTGFQRSSWGAARPSGSSQRNSPGGEGRGGARGLPHASRPRGPAEFCPAAAPELPPRRPCRASGSRRARSDQPISPPPHRRSGRPLPCRRYSDNQRRLDRSPVIRQ